MQINLRRVDVADRRKDRENEENGNFWDTKWAENTNMKYLSISQADGIRYY